MFTISSEQLDALIEQAKSLNELATALVEATKALQSPPVPGEDTFTQAELDNVLAEVEKLKVALTALVPTVPTPPEV